MREGGTREDPAQFLCPFFTNCIYWVNLGNGEGGGGPCPNLLAFKKGGGFEVILTKSKRTATFFFGKPSLRPSLHSLITLPKRVMGGGNEQSSRLGSWKWPTWQGDVGDQEDDEFDNRPCQCLLSAWKTEPAWTWCEQCGYRRYCNQV